MSSWNEIMVLFSFININYRIDKYTISIECVQLVLKNVQFIFMISRKINENEFACLLQQGLQFSARIVYSVFIKIVTIVILLLYSCNIL